jgi:hypothetical protein
MPDFVVGNVLIIVTAVWLGLAPAVLMIPESGHGCRACPSGGWSSGIWPTRSWCWKPAPAAGPVADVLPGLRQA